MDGEFHRLGNNEQAVSGLCPFLWEEVIKDYIFSQAIRAYHWEIFSRWWSIMERNQLFNWLAALLGFAALGLPANMEFDSEMATAFWILTIYAGKSEPRMLLADPEIGGLMTPFFISGLLLAAGAVMMLLTLLPNLKFKMPVAWLPALLIVAGIGMYVVCASTIDLEGPIFALWPVPIGLSAGIGSAVFSILPFIPMKTK
jgi:hypothetical protein